jgi:hypothetical protein
MPKPIFFIYNGFKDIQQLWSLLENWKVHDVGSSSIYNAYSLKTQIA